jgi:DNA-binding XRE family transcriptional regulator
MLVHTKKPRINAKHGLAKRSNNTKMDTNNITILVICPAINASSVKQYLKKHGCVCVDDEEELMDVKGMFAERTPANMLIGARGKESITQNQLAELTGIPRRHISDMENGRRPIGKHNAMKLGKALNTNYRLFL